MPNKRKPVPHMCSTCQHYEPYHCNLNDGYIGYLDCEIITKCRAWRLSDNYKEVDDYMDMCEDAREGLTTNDDPDTYIAYVEGLREEKEKIDNPNSLESILIKKRGANA